MRIKPAAILAGGALVLGLAFVTAQRAEADSGAMDYRPVTAEVAAQVAEAHLLRLGKSGAFIPGAAVAVRGEDDATVLYYRFDLHPQGYVVVAGDYKLPPVIAYSLNSTFGSDADGANPLARLLRADIRRRLARFSVLPPTVPTRRLEQWTDYLDGDVTAPSERAFQQWPPAGTTSTGGWLESNWTQNAPYNNYCPIDLPGGSRSVAGCPAVAMAQILNYHEEINHTRFDDGDDYYHNYGGNQYWIDDDHELYDFASFPELNGYLDVLVDHYENEVPLTNSDMAALTFACGVAAHQVYSPSGSGTFGVDQALDAYLRFGCDTVELLDDGDPDVYERLSQNMKDAYPAHLATVDPSWMSGHNMVVDGYNTDEYFHINFGWGGSYNGWYLLPDEIPFGLTVLEGVIVDIMIRDSEIPAVSAWGVSVMALLMLTTGTLVFTGRRSAPAGSRTGNGSKAASQPLVTIRE